MNDKKRVSLRRGYYSGSINSRGALIVGSEAKLVKEYQQRAHDVERAGYQRLAKILRDLANRHEQDVKLISSLLEQTLTSPKRPDTASIWSSGNGVT
ncbi:MAG: hypothetical protein QS721_14850 [Candidatus Endonucleobacter sp. (ex Gigantidas childressi)]|nr:hypothetical protein [Candidatus Endonucleobacter sp. (ex Gigantidas childressi)]